MFTFNSSVRTTFKYIDAHRHLDEWAETYTFKALAHRRTEEPTGSDSGGSVVIRVVGDKGRDQARQAQALESCFGGSSCTHEHDCCGCPTSYADVTRVKRGIFSVHVTTTYNY